MFEFSSSPSVEELRVNQEEFIYQKMHWDAWQTPRNLFLALVGELGELSVDVVSNEKYTNQESDDTDKDEKLNTNSEDSKNKVEEVLSELADVLSYLICLAQECQVDIAVPDTLRKNESSSTFSEVSWNEIEVTAFYRTVRISEKTGIISDFLSICFSASRLADEFQWIIVDKNLKNLSRDKQEITDEKIKDLFCQVVVFASKYAYDLPKLLQEKNIKVAQKYCKSIGILTKDDVITSRYSHLPLFHNNGSTSKDPDKYLIDKSVKTLQASTDRLLCKLLESAGLVAESFQWKTDLDDALIVAAISDPMHAHLCNQLSTITNLIQTLAQLHSLSLAESFNKKMYKNREKYSLSNSKGSFVKYSEKAEDTSDHDRRKNDTEPNNKYPTATTLADATVAMQLFVDEREWNKYHKNPRNLTIALFGEIGEVIELFIEKRSTDFTARLGDELSDCLAYTVRLASCCDIDLTAAMLHHFP